ncbi:hypothetical protein KP509_09G039400 [Ceratopteris richardii]|uniref:RING-type domain-containing protein n=1 Tax=Ceratopteris richardii TaxID=49495 RepID=A0A8T2TZN6_CERRI|nr:hypothetical protein KP509_09G039400 [Ceratopteris richardii]
MVVLWLQSLIPIVISFVLTILRQTLIRVAQKFFAELEEELLPDLSHRENERSLHRELELLAVVSFADARMLSGVDEGSECAVCLSTLHENDELHILSPCNHAFHADCIREWIASNLSSGRCPTCRQRLKFNSSHWNRHRFM